ncbi:hypothetical protein CGRA01v4_00482 [Colletotrichum graminicola]|nr:hypothetical protein CGRA01v4_00482 [Colletotrichum graminicola]
MPSRIHRLFGSGMQPVYVQRQTRPSQEHDRENDFDCLLSGPTSDKSFQENLPSSPDFGARRTLHIGWKILKIFLILAIAFYIVLHLSFIEKLVETNKAEFTEHRIDCGHNTASAKAAGCVYDIMMVGWTAPDCIDPYVSSDSLSETSELASVRGAGHFNFSVTPDFTEIIQQDVDSLTQHDWVYANWEFHKAHCAYVWRVLANALERKRNGDTNVYIYRTLVTYEHAVHCSRVLLGTDRSLAAPTKIQVSGTNRCVLL